MTGNAFADIKADTFREVYFDIKEKIDELLYNHNKVDFLKNPAIDIKTIATENGIKAIKRVPRKEIPEKHATLENGVIKLNEEDDPFEQRFSIGHELEHHLRNKAILNEERDQIKPAAEPRIEAGMEKTSIDDDPPALLKDAARWDFNEIAQKIASDASERLGKPIPGDKAYSSIAKLICKATDDLYNEEVADYFAANLLVPIERFMLWEDRPDEEIAAAFQVPVNCIKKRREEIELELEYLAE